MIFSDGLWIWFDFVRFFCDFFVFSCDFRGLSTTYSSTLGTVCDLQVKFFLGGTVCDLQVNVGTTGPRLRPHPPCILADLWRVPPHSNNNPEILIKLEQNSQTMTRKTSVPPKKNTVTLPKIPIRPYLAPSTSSLSLSHFPPFLPLRSPSPLSTYSGSSHFQKTYV